ncbi:MAG TPA: hypothetical protein PK228_19025 [Saprospiraceae bacterium]|nr:hypothetical protein [Saprospiraceae bacterium]
MRNAIQTIGLLLFIILAANEVNAQIQNVWVGGMPGRPIDWNVAANWSLQRVPNEFHDVVIPNTASTTFSYPVIDESVEIHSLRIEKGARLYILETGELFLNAVGMEMSEVLVNSGEIENRSNNPIGFDKSVFEEDKAIVSARKN